MTVGQIIVIVKNKGRVKVTFRSLRKLVPNKQATQTARSIAKRYNLLVRIDIKGKFVVFTSKKQKRKG